MRCYMHYLNDKLTEICFLYSKKKCKVLIVALALRVYLVKQDVLRSGEVEALLAGFVLQYGARQLIRNLNVAAVELIHALRCVTQQRRRLLHVTGVHQRCVTRQTLQLQT